MSQLTIGIIILLVALFWKFGPWNRRRRILSYEFPIGWWNHVANAAPDYERWSEERRSRLKDYIRLFVDRTNFEVASDLQIEFQIQHRVLFATQAFLLFGHLRSDPLEPITHFSVERRVDSNNGVRGLPRLFTEDLEKNYITFFEVSRFAGSLQPDELSQLSELIQQNESLQDVLNLKDDE